MIRLFPFESARFQPYLGDFPITENILYGLIARAEDIH